MSRPEREIPPSLDRKPLTLTEKREKPTSVAVAVLIVGLDSGRDGDNESDPLIWTIYELKSKFETDKIAGQISIPAETRKNGEDVESNVFGALAEFCDDTAFPYVKRHVIKTDSEWYREKGITVRERPVDVAVLIYDGAIDFPLKPACPDEVSPNGWVKKSELVADPRLRDMLRQVLELDDREELIRNVLKSYHNSPEGKRQVFAEDFDSIRKFYNRREFGIDVEVLPWGYREVSERLPEAREHIVDAISLLVESQKSKEGRDFRREDKIVSDLEDFICTICSNGIVVGIREIDGLGIKVVNGAPRGGFKVWGKERKRLCQKQRNPDDYKLQSITETLIKRCYGFWELQRGDTLGYPAELGKDWYLVFHNRATNNKYGNYGIIPINKISDFQLCPYDNGF